MTMDLKVARKKKEAPYEIVQEILSRLPTKAAVRFSCVSKLWFSAVRDVYFRSLHYNRMGSDPKPVILLLSYSKNRDENVISVRASSSGPTGFSPGGNIPLYQFSTRQNYELCNTSNGLLCFAPHDPAEPIIVCNPVTNESVALPAAPPPIEEDCYCFVALGFCSTSHGYKVFRISYPREGNYVALQAEGGPGVLEVCNVGCTESWRRVCRLCGCPSGKPVCVDGKIHWLISRAPYCAGHCEMLSVDVCSQKYICTTIPRVTEFKRRELFNLTGTSFKFSILELEGCVAVAANYLTARLLLIWVLKDLEHNRWELRYTCFPLLSPAMSVTTCIQEIVNVCYHDGILLLRLHHQWVMFDTREHSSTFPPLRWNVDASEILSITEEESLIGGFYPSLLPAKEFASCSSKSGKICDLDYCCCWFPRTTEDITSAIAKYVLHGYPFRVRAFPLVEADASLSIL